MYAYLHTYPASANYSRSGQITSQTAQFNPTYPRAREARTQLILYGHSQNYPYLYFWRPTELVGVIWPRMATCRPQHVG